jgi:hypothetical protein
MVTQKGSRGAADTVVLPAILRHLATLWNFQSHPVRSIPGRARQKPRSQAVRRLLQKGVPFPNRSRATASKKGDSCGGRGGKKGALRGGGNRLFSNRISRGMILLGGPFALSRSRPSGHCLVAAVWTTHYVSIDLGSAHFGQGRRVACVWPRSRLHRFSPQAS